MIFSLFAYLCKKRITWCRFVWVLIFFSWMVLTCCKVLYFSVSNEYNFDEFWIGSNQQHYTEKKNFLDVVMCFLLRALISNFILKFYFRWYFFCFPGDFYLDADFLFVCFLYFFYMPLATFKKCLILLHTQYNKDHNSQKIIIRT